MQMIWGAIVTSTVIYAGMAYWMAAQPSTTMETALRNPLVLGLYVASLGAFVMGIVLRRVLTTVSSQLRMIASLAVFETCAIFGFVAALLQHDWRLYLAPWALALLGFMLSRPSEESVSLPRPR